MWGPQGPREGQDFCRLLETGHGGGYCFYGDSAMCGSPSQGHWPPSERNDSYTYSALLLLLGREASGQRVVHTSTQGDLFTQVVSPQVGAQGPFH